MTLPPQDLSPILGNFCLEVSDKRPLTLVQVLCPWQFSNCKTLVIRGTPSKMLLKVELAFLFLFVHVLFDWSQKGKKVRGNFFLWFYNWIPEVISFWQRSRQRQLAVIGKKPTNQPPTSNMEIQSQILDSVQPCHLKVSYYPLFVSSFTYLQNEDLGQLISKIFSR